MVTRTLVTTADERTWPTNKNESVLFLGEWCKIYSRKAVWQHMHANTALYHWDDRKKLFEDYKYLQELHENLLCKLSDELNRIHCTKHSLRYWRILIGPWLGWFVQILFDRWFMLKHVVEKENIDKCNVIKRDPVSIIPNDMSHFGSISVHDDWNEAIYGQLMELCWKDVIGIEVICVDKVNKKGRNHQHKGMLTMLRRYFSKLIPVFNKLLPNDNGYFFILSGLPQKIELLLQIRLKQFPKMWRHQVAPVVNPDIYKRKWELSIEGLDNDEFAEVACQLVSKHIPVSYLEGYKRLDMFVAQLPWPTNPKVIFTSNGYASDDVFKFWVAEKVEKDIPLIIGQHGGNFGMTPFSFYEDHQIKISDKWLSWGWTDKANRHITPVGNLKHFGTEVNYDPNGGALMVELIIPRYSYYIYSIAISRQWLDYFEDQQCFLKELPKPLRRKVLLRLGANDYGWNQKARWKDIMPEVNIDQKRHLNIVGQIRKSRLYISTYNATGYLESMNWNVPTIIFWNENHWELTEEVKPYFEMLKSVGIFHETPQSAAKQMIEVWDDIDAWWLSDPVQSVRSIFCKQFSYSPENPIADLKKLFSQY